MVEGFYENTKKGIIYHKKTPFKNGVY